ncbi:preprotein translocase subunit SecA [Pseudomonas aeruginosa]
MKALDNLMLKRTLDDYRDEAEAILEFSEGLKNHPESTIASNFQALCKTPTRDKMLVGYALIAQMVERKLGMTPYTEQIMGALAMGDSRIIEMGTGEGKTLTAAFPLAWNALFGRCHAITHNDYLAQRDTAFLQPLYEGLHVTCDYVLSNFTHSTRQLAYRASIVYGTASQFVFDYLRDNTALEVDRVIQQGRHFALIDEADSILIDEARTPYILTADGNDGEQVHQYVRALVSSFEVKEGSLEEISKLERMIDKPEAHDADALINVRNRSITATERGLAKAEAYFLEHGLIVSKDDLWNPSSSSLWAHFNAALKAQFIYQEGKDYLVIDGKVAILDPDTGRLTPERRWNEGLHQAVECKEGVSIRPESIETGRISLASYLNTYNHVAGMTGTALAVSNELLLNYGLRVIPIPPHLPSQRIEHEDRVFATRDGKISSILADIIRTHQTGQPILVGTSSEKDSKELSECLTKALVPHKLLNAMQTSNEANIIAEAGRLGAITISTNMAGRGTDILLGGSAKVDSRLSEEREAERERILSLGGLYVIGADRMESRRLDRQLAGRSGRQGDPGRVQFYASLEDDLLRRFGAKGLSRLFQAAGSHAATHGLSSPTISKAIERAQTMRQAMAMDVRRIGIQQDRILDKPRALFFAKRRELLWMEPEAVLEQLTIIDGLAAKRLVNAYCVGQPVETATYLMMEKADAWGVSSSMAKLLIEKAGPDLGHPNFVSEVVRWLSFERSARSKDLLEDEPNTIRLCLLLGIDAMWQDVLNRSEAFKSASQLQAYVGKNPALAFEEHVYKAFLEAYEDIPVAQLDLIFDAIEQHRKNKV